ncbi:MAG TPA: diguanylate cyclase, partial [Vibrio sp.]|nr:diguanylate cyclase [Vibrio sp.]
CVARYGGEEFAFILPNTTQQGALVLAERIHAAVSQLSIPHKGSQVSEFITVSIGVVSLIPKSDHSAEALVAQADSALYQAKANGRNQTSIHHTSGN